MILLTFHCYFFISFIFPGWYITESELQAMEEQLKKKATEEKVDLQRETESVINILVKNLRINAVSLLTREVYMIVTITLFINSTRRVFIVMFGPPTITLTAKTIHS